jgi:hypothetical protein
MAFASGWGRDNETTTPRDYEPKKTNGRNCQHPQKNKKFAARGPASDKSADEEMVTDAIDALQDRWRPGRMKIASLGEKGKHLEKNYRQKYRRKSGAPKRHTHRTA